MPIIMKINCKTMINKSLYKHTKNNVYNNAIEGHGKIDIT